MIYRGSFKVRDRQIFCMDVMVADVNDSFYTAYELIDRISGYDEELLFDFVRKHAKKKTGSTDLLQKFMKHLGIEPFPEILRKWMHDYGYEATPKGYRKFDDDFWAKRLPRQIVEADVARMSDEEVMSFVRKNKRRNIEAWHALRMQIRRINDPKDHWFSYCDQREERQLAYRYTAGCIAGMEGDALVEMIEVAQDPWRWCC